MNSDAITGIGRSLPIYAIGPALLLALVLIVGLMARTRSQAARFVFFAIWLRCMLSALHVFSFARSPIGLSYNALASIGVVAAGVFILRKRRLLDPAFIPFYPLLAIFLVSGILNAQIGPMSTALTKLAYLLVLILAVEDAIQDLGAETFFRRFLLPFSLPVLLQLLSVAFNVAKPGENDGSASYIGGFYHEAAFSVLLATPILAACMLRDIEARWKLLLILVGLGGILLANYRTAIISVLPLIGLVIFLDLPRRFVPQQRALVGGVLALALVAAAGGGSILFADRFSDIGTVATEGTDLIKRPELFSTEDRRVMSGRPMIWSGYYYTWKDASPARELIGFGPESWVKAFPLYAHNTLVSALYEVGILGTVAILFLWLWMFGMAVLARGGPRGELIAAHLAFFILNMATMPMWMIEGMIFYGLLCGYTIRAYKDRRREARPKAPIGQGRSESLSRGAA